MAPSNRWVFPIWDKMSLSHLFGNPMFMTSRLSDKMIWKLCHSSRVNTWMCTLRFFEDDADPLQSWGCSKMERFLADPCGIVSNEGPRKLAWQKANHLAWRVCHPKSTVIAAGAAIWNVETSSDCTIDSQRSQCASNDICLGAISKEKFQTGNCALPQLRNGFSEAKNNSLLRRSPTKSCNGPFQQIGKRSVNMTAKTSL